MSDIQTLAHSVHDLATPEMKPKELIAAVRAKHPEASKKDVIRAAFYAVIAHADDADPAKVAQLHTMAITERGTDEEPEEPKPAKKKRKG